MPHNASDCLRTTDVTIVVAAVDDTVLGKQVDELVGQLKKQGMQTYSVGDAPAVLKRRVSVHLGTVEKEAATETVVGVMIDLKIDEDKAQVYAGLLKEQLGVDDVDDLFYLEEAVLNGIEMKFVHRRKLMSWIQHKTNAVV